MTLEDIEELRELLIAQHAADRLTGKTLRHYVSRSPTGPEALADLLLKSLRPEGRNPFDGQVSHHLQYEAKPVPQGMVKTTIHTITLHELFTNSTIHPTPRDDA